MKASNIIMRVQRKGEICTYHTLLNCLLTCHTGAKHLLRSFSLHTVCRRSQHLERTLSMPFDSILQHTVSLPINKKVYPEKFQIIHFVVVLPAPPHWLCTALLHYAALPTFPSLTPLRIHSFHHPATLPPAAENTLVCYFMLARTHAKIE